MATEKDKQLERARHAARVRLYQARLKAAGRCAICGRDKGGLGTYRCAVCLVKARERMRLKLKEGAKRKNTISYWMEELLGLQLKDEPWYDRREIK